MESKKLPAFYFIVVVWGEDYVDMLLQIALRSFLSPKNIPRLSNLHESRFVFATTKHDYKKISESPIFQKLESYIQPVFLELDEDNNESVHVRMTLGYEMASKLCYEKSAYAVYLLPDCIVSDGSFLSLENYAQQGRDVVLMPGPRIIKHQFMSYIKNLRLDAAQPFNFAARELVDIGLSMLHNQFKNYNYTDKKFTKWPHLVTWNIPGQKGLLIRSFHLHPILVNFSNRKELVLFNKSDTIDGNFISRNFLDLNKFYLETDSDNMLLFSMSNEEDIVEHGLLWSIKEKLQAVITMSQSDLVNELHKIYFYNTYKLHVNDLSSEWYEVERDSRALMKSVLSSRQIKNKYPTFSMKTKKWLLKILPEKSKDPLKQMYWRSREVLSRIRAKNQHL